MKRFPPDHQLVIDLKYGRPEAVQAWYQQYATPLREYLSQKVKNSADADELTHDVFMSCLKHLPLFRGESSIWTWMIHIAQHEVADYYRRSYAKKVIQTLPVNDLGELPELENSFEISQRVKNVLRKMSATSRELLQRKYIDKQKVKHISQAMGRSDKAIESLLFRARIEFRELYALEVE